MAAFPSSGSGPSQPSGPSGVSMPASYASAAANALNNNISVGAISAGAASNIVTVGGGGGAPSLSSAAGSLVLKNVQSLAYCYAIDCKSSYEELNRIMRVSRTR